jgi:hypothetical protein
VSLVEEARLIVDDRVRGEMLDLLHSAGLSLEVESEKTSPDVSESVDDAAEEEEEEEDRKEEEETGEAADVENEIGEGEYDHDDASGREVEIEEASDGEGQFE